MNAYLLFTFVTCWIAPAQGDEEWGYDGQTGPENWGKNYPDCDKTAQSPINIESNAAKVDLSLGVFDRNKFVKPSSMTLRNTGHSIQVSLTNGYVLPDGMGGLPGAFKGTQFHFHWGSEKGSEHTLDEERFFGEMHLVHYNEKFSSAGASQGKIDGMAVLGFFVKDDASEDNPHFSTILNHINAVGKTNQSTELEAFPVKNLLPDNIDHFYRYTGSLTTPPCSENVIWTMFDQKISISSNQANILKGMVEITSNYRPIQPLNNRIVHKNFQNGNGRAALAGGLSLTTILAIICGHMFLF